MQTLVLNASYEPLAVVSVRRAVVLVLTEKAVMEHADEARPIRSPSRQLPTPLVVRLLKFVRVPYRRKLPWSRRECWSGTGTVRLLRRAGIHRRSLVPVSRGGEERSWLNTVSACVPCNQAKADRTPDEAGMRLLLTPHEPKAHAALVLAIGVTAAESLPEWLATATA